MSNNISELKRTFVRIIGLSPANFYRVKQDNQKGMVTKYKKDGERNTEEGDHEGDGDDRSGGVAKKIP